MYTYGYYKAKEAKISALTFPCSCVTTDKSWKGYKRLLSRVVLLICVMTVTVFALIQGFSYTKFSTFYKIVKRKIYQKLHYNFGV